MLKPYGLDLKLFAPEIVMALIVAIAATEVCRKRQFF